MSEKDVFEKMLKGYVLSYLAYRRCAERDDASPKHLMKVLERFARAEEKLLLFVRSVYEADADSEYLPNLESYFHDETGEYHDFAYRLYSAVYNAGQYPAGAWWSAYALVYAGEIIRENFNNKKAAAA